MINDKTNIIFVGMKHAGKSTISQLYAERNKMNIIELDSLIATNFEYLFKQKLSVREIYSKLGEELFRKYEQSILSLIFNLNISNTIIDCGGGTIQNIENRKIIKENCKVIWLKLDETINFKRIMQYGIPSFFKYQDDPLKSFGVLVEERFPLYNEIADCIIEYSIETPEILLAKINNTIFNH